MDKVHVVKAGENLTRIAQEHGLASWEFLYYARENSGFRRTNPDPDRIMAGARLAIPQSTQQRRQAIEGRIRRLQKVKAEARTLFEDQKKALAGDFRSTQRLADTVDTTATIATILVDLTQLTKKAHGIMQLSDEAAEAATRDFARDALLDRAEKAGDLGALVIKETESSSSNPVWLATKSLGTAWCDMTAPSFWASTVVNLANGMSWSDAVTTMPKDIHDKAQAALRRTAAQVMADLDAKLAIAQREYASIR